MKVKQTVSTKFYQCYPGWNSLEFTDENGDEIQVQMTDDDYLNLAKTLGQKAERIQKERQAEAEKAAKLAEENADE
jgi:hypothetical protein